jgi:membrane-associated phospholipid phosphatase
MRSPQPRHARILSTLLAGVLCAATAHASGDPVDSPIPPEAGTIQASGAAVVVPAGEEPMAAVQPPADEPQPYRPPAFPKMVLLDVGHVLSSPFRWQGSDWLFFSASTAAIGVLSLADESLSNSARERGTTLGFVGDTSQALGDARSFVLLGGFYLAGAIGLDSKAKDVCLDGLAASLIATGMITPVISTLVGRERPTAEQGAYSFKPFDGRSFPSGHATQAFAVASVIATSYDQLWVKVAAYGTAAVTAYIRVQRGQHFPTDVVAGALIGTAVGQSVVRFNRKLRSGEKEPEPTGVTLTVVPVVGDGSYGLSASLEF